MDKIEKELRKLTIKERELVRDIVAKLSAGQFQTLDMKKLKGREDIFRARKGDIRIIYRMRQKKIFVLAIERRSERTYRL